MRSRKWISQLKRSWFFNSLLTCCQLWSHLRQLSRPQIKFCLSCSELLHNFKSFSETFRERSSEKVSKGKIAQCLLEKSQYLFSILQNLQKLHLKFSKNIIENESLKGEPPSLVHFLDSTNFLLMIPFSRSSDSFFKLLRVEFLGRIGLWGLESWVWIIGCGVVLGGGVWQVFCFGGLGCGHLGSGLDWVSFSFCLCSLD